MKILEILITIGFYICLPFYYIERVIHKKSSGWKQKFGYCEQIDGNVIMLHACSVGETTALEPLVKRIKAEFPETKIVITTSTITGQNVAKNKYGNIADYITYFPFDALPCVKRFLSRINPKAVFIVETEIWPCFAAECKLRNIQVSIINGRISDTSYSSYKFAKLLFKKIFSNYFAVYTQSKEDSEKFISIGMDPDKTEFMGNIKFCMSKTDEKVDLGQEGYRVFLAGSTHKKENPIVIDTYNELKRDCQKLKLLIAPRHLERVKEIEGLLKKDGLQYGLRSKNDKFSDNIDVIILDTLGELKKMYLVSEIAYIGGSFNNTGGHNPLEASICLVPVLSGPSIFNFKDIYSILTKSGAAKIVENKNDLVCSIKELLVNAEKYKEAKLACEKVFDEQSGSVDFVINKIKEMNLFV